MWTFFRLPEPKGKTYAELDVLFERRISARQFKSSTADPFRGDNLEVRNGSIAARGGWAQNEKEYDVVQKENVHEEISRTESNM